MSRLLVLYALAAGAAAQSAGAGRIAALEAELAALKYISGGLSCTDIRGDDGDASLAPLPLDAAVASEGYAVSNVNATGVPVLLELTVRIGETLVELPSGKGMRVIAEPLETVDPGLFGGLPELGGMDLWGFVGANFATLCMCVVGLAVLALIESKTSVLGVEKLKADLEKYHTVLEELHLMVDIIEGKSSMTPRSVEGGNDMWAKLAMDVKEAKTEHAEGAPFADASTPADSTTTDSFFQAFPGMLSERLLVLHVQVVGTLMAKRHNEIEQMMHTVEEKANLRLMQSKDMAEQGLAKAQDMVLHADENLAKAQDMAETGQELAASDDARKAVCAARAGNERGGGIVGLKAGAKALDTDKNRECVRNGAVSAAEGAVYAAATGGDAKSALKTRAAHGVKGATGVHVPKPRVLPRV